MGSVVHSTAFLGREAQIMAPHGGIYWAFLALMGWGCADYLARTASGRIGSVSVTLLTLTIGLAAPLPFVLVEISQGALAVDWPTSSTTQGCSAALQLWSPP